MNTKISSSKLIGTAIRENMRRFWPVSLIALVIYFFSGPYHLIIKSSNKMLADSYTFHQLVENYNVGFLFVHCMAPIVAALCVFGYLHKTSSVAVMNSLPLSRKSLYLANVLSGFLLCTIPMLLVFGILLVVVPGGMMALIKWLLFSLILELVVFLISVFSHVVTGTAIHGFLGSFLFNALIPALFVAFLVYSTFFLYGLDSNEAFLRFIGIISPFTGILVNEGTMSAGMIAYYLTIAAVLFMGSLVLYQKRAMEHAGEAVSWKVLEPILSIIIAFFGMSLFGAYFLYANGSLTRSFLVGCAVGYPISYFVSRMIVMKSFRVFNKKDLKVGLIGLVICALILTGYNFDVFGIEYRVPNASSVEEVTVDSGMSADAFSLLYSSDFSYRFPAVEQTFKSEETIDAVIALHKEILEEHKKDVTNAKASTDLPSGSAVEITDLDYIPYDPVSRRCSMDFDYKIAGPFGFSRNYTVSYDMLYRSPSIKTLFESKEWKESCNLNAQIEYMKECFDTEEINLAQLAVTDVFGGNSSIIRDEKQKDLLLKAMEKDWMNCTSEDIMDHSLPICKIQISYKLPLADPAYNEKFAAAINCSIYPYCTETLALLQEYTLNVKPEDIAGMRIIYRNRTGSYPMESKHVIEFEYDTNVGSEFYKVTSKKTLDTLLSNATLHPADSAEYYLVEIQTVNDNYFSLYLDSIDGIE